MSKVRRDPIWHRDIAVLWARWDDFFPRASQTTAERINAAVRFFIYASAILFAYNQKYKYVLFGLVCIGVVTFMYDDKLVTSPEDLFEISESNNCVRPTKNNPFGNYLLSDNPNRPAACPYEQVANETKLAFNDGLFRNVADVYERENSQRQFYRMPVTTAIADTKAFADFLYGHHVSCKDKSEKCTGSIAGGGSRGNGSSSR